MRKNPNVPFGLILFLFLANTNCFQNTMKQVHISLKCGNVCDDLMYRLVVDGNEQGEMSIDQVGKISFEIDYRRHNTVVLQMHAKSSKKYGCDISIPMNSSTFKTTISDFTGLYPSLTSPVNENPAIEKDTLLGQIPSVSGM